MPLATPQLTKFTTSSAILANYDYVDILNGLGIIEFNLCGSKTSAGNNYELQTNNMRASVRYINGLQSSNPKTTTFDSIPLNSARTAKGIAYFEGTLVDPDRHNDTAHLTVQLYKYNPTTTTETPISSEITSNTIDQDKSPTFSLLIPIELTETTIAIGEQLRMVVKIYQYGQSYVYLGTDPSNRDSDKITVSDNAQSKSTIYVPFKINS